MYCQFIAFMTSKNEIEPKVLKNVSCMTFLKSDCILYTYYNTKSNNVPI